MKFSELKAKQSEAFGKFPCFFAFSDDQFAKGMASLGVTDSKELYHGTGGMFYAKKDAPALHALMESLDAEKTAWLADPANLAQAIRYELDNHEYGYTYDATDALDALGLSVETMTPDQLEILKKAKKASLTAFEW